MTTWEARLATALAWLGVVPGLACFWLADRVFRADDSFLFVVIPLVGGFLVLAGAALVTGAATLAVRLQTGHRSARLQGIVTGTCIAIMGLLMLGDVPVAGLLFVGYGGALAGLLLRTRVTTDLGPVSRAYRQPAPWGSTPGTGIWSSEPVQQGPWAPDPTTLPWFTWQGHSGPRTPWWQTWRAGLAQGIPLWELVVLVAALLAFVVGLVCVPLAVGGTHVFMTTHLRRGNAKWGLLLLPLSWGVVAWLEQRMRRRLAGR